MFDPSQFSYQQQQCPPLIPTEPYIQPPGTHLFANYASQPVWTPIGYDSVTQPGNETAYPTANPNSFWVTQPAATGHVHPPQEANVVQSVRCDVCNVDCNNRDVFEKHVLGKKHKGNLEARNNPMAMMLAASNAVNHISLPNQMGIGASAVMSASPMLETKTIKVLNSGTAVGSVLGCMTCNVVCNSQDVYNKHMLGKKHAIQASLAALGEAGPYFAAIRAQFEGTYNKKAPKKVKFVQTAWCEVCKIMCNSSDAYASHLAGKKHNFNLEQLRNPSNNPMIGLVENAEASKSKSIATVAKKASEEDMLAKRQKIVQAGTAAAMIRTCTICNVVCNSLAVFNSHLGGQKHKDMLQKFQASGSGGM